MTETSESPKRPLLSFAIPTYNRAKYLEQLLAAFLPQLNGESRVEVIISDNASTDDTRAVVEAYLQKGIEIRYIQNEVNRGADFNILQCYEQAKGKYVWIFSDDDLILDGGLSIVLSLLERENLDFVFLTPYSFRNTVTAIRSRMWTKPSKVINAPIEMIAFVNQHSDLIFISAGIVNKEYVSSISHPPFSSLLGTNLVQLGWIFTSLCYFRHGAIVQPGTIAQRTCNSSGGFHAATVFGTNYRKVITAWVASNPKLASRLLKDHLQLWFPRHWIGFRLNKKEDRISNTILCKAFSDNIWYWVCAYPIMCAPLNLARIYAKALRILQRILVIRV